MRLLSQETIRKLHSTAIALRLDRRELLSWINPSFAASLPSGGSTTGALLQDLNVLNTVPTLTDGSVPLRDWLEIATSLAETRPERFVFQSALDELGGSRSGPAEPAHPTLQSPIDPSDDPRGVRMGLGHTRSTTPAPTSENDTTRLYLSYAEEDISTVQRFEKHLKQLPDTHVWHRGHVRAGGFFRDEIEKELREADIIVLIVSADYLASKPAMEEADRAMERRYLGKAIVFPVLVRSCYWELAPFSKVPMFPRSGQPLSAHRNQDDAYQGLIEELLVILRDLYRRREEPSPKPQKGSPAATIAITEIFRTSGPPAITFVEPVQMNQIRAALTMMGKGLIVEGPSQIGKSTVIEAAFDELERDAPSATATWVRLGEPSGLELLRDLLKPGQLSNHLVIDDAQLLDAPERDRVCALVRQLADNRAPKGKVTLIGAPGTSHKILTDIHVKARFTTIPMTKQPDDRIQSLVSKGEAAANVRFEHAGEIVLQSRGSFRLAQEICLAMLIQDGVIRSAKSERLISISPNDVRNQIMSSLGFDEALIAFARTDRNTDGQGAALGLLWMLSESPDLMVTLFAAKRRYSHLVAGFEWLESAGLDKMLDDASPLKLCELLAHRDGQLEAIDPRLGYYLSAVGWQSFGERAGVGARVTERGELFIPARERAAAAAQVRAESWLDMVPYPTNVPEAVNVYDLLMNAYSNLTELRAIAGRVGLKLDLLIDQHGIGPAWESALRLAASQDKLRALIDAVLKDPLKAGYHRELRKACQLEEPENTKRNETMTARKHLSPFDPGTVEIRSGDHQGEHLGVGYIEDGPERRQRWVLFPGYKGPPDQKLFMVKAEKQYGSLGEWTQDVRNSLWRQGSLYVKAELNLNQQVFSAREIFAIIQGAKITGYVGIEGPMSDHLTAVRTSSTPVQTTEVWTLLREYSAIPTASAKIGDPTGERETLSLHDRLYQSRERFDVIVMDCETQSVLPGQL